MSDSEPLPTINNAEPGDTIRILLATDNHIGYLERDPIRGQDSIITFKEILQLAVKNKVDFILLAGDLFHENRPSRDCLYKTIALLREYTLGDKPVQIELLSDPDQGKADGFSFPAVNYEDPNYNVSIPVFSIHGNHDDPQGAGPEGALCALDVLSVSGLINYMGKFDLPLSSAEAQSPDSSSSGITIRPVLLKKGATHLGLFGIGNVKDARMHFELRSNRVKMYMPKNKDEWFNILLLHQNRVKHGPQESVPEGMFDDSVDLVVWGHEHDCRIVPESVAGKKYYISQPGSSVATSLADGEALEKHVALLQIQGKEFSMTPIPLQTVRPFVIESLSLSEVAEKEGLDISDQMAITKFLKSRVNALIEQANELRQARLSSTSESSLALDLSDLDPEQQKPMLPLIRLKVDTTGVSEMSNPIRFGQEFANKIANPRDVLVFHRSKKVGAKGVRADEPDLDDATLGLVGEDGEGLTSAERLAKVRVATLVGEYLRAQELQLLGEAGMSDAIQTFVEKDDPHAIQSHVNGALKALIKGVKAGEEIDEDVLDELLAKAKEEHEQDYIAKTKGTKGKGKAKAKGKNASDGEENAGQGGGASEDSMMMDADVPGGNANAGLDSDEEEEEAPRKRGTTSAAAKKRGGAAGGTGTRGRKTATTTAAARKTAAAPKAAAKKAPAKRGKKVVESDDDDDDEFVDVDKDLGDEEDDILEVSEEEVRPAPTTKRTNRAAVLSQTAMAAKKAPPRKKATATATKQSTLTGGGARAGSSRAAATKARAKVVVELDSD